MSRRCGAGYEAAPPAARFAGRFHNPAVPMLLPPQTNRV